jgi:hypothetical protein
MNPSKSALAKPKLSEGNRAEAGRSGYASVATAS